MNREKENELSPTPLNPDVGIDMEFDKIQNETNEITEKNVSE